MTASDIMRPQSTYRGRFAPSPSGYLHFGSLITALASFLDAKKNNGTWLVRLEDIDPPREKKGASAHILKTLAAFGLHWDENILYQSKQTDYYQHIIEQLFKEQYCYYCQCTRAQIKAIGGIYQGHCRHLNLDKNHSAIRVINQIQIDQYSDLIQGKIQCDKALAREDFIIRRKDGLFAYQLAVVADDIYQNISHVIRGCDLLEPTTRQLSFYQLLSDKAFRHVLWSAQDESHVSKHLQAPVFGHIPLAITEQGYKLSKQNKAPAIDIQKPQPALFAALQFLGQQPPIDLKHLNVDEIIQWAIAHWQLESVPKKQEIQLT
ncbi:tRNA glutamyl-Q(34) synthetase GluQRS [Colwellia sp. 1_MG-2023]|uniref:tRNA glutamyl-Q(34) synthetase GluQRS n=1 Tax=Colwellia sp. 1_MG-2023 TaxID=3062649 RepID=UPI0026E3CE35|nr:tRNA glutamyl-Q(34) synthetase GluQRS [Colwellia sp. 1_MG-2023]MDO6444877.1 tRNA glutamyl-Q(34) synthetase GluQRS [Colwellia sp. 1_MG-2023]